AAVVGGTIATQPRARYEAVPGCRAGGASPRLHANRAHDVRVPGAVVLRATRLRSRRDHRRPPARTSQPADAQAPRTDIVTLGLWRPGCHDRVARPPAQHVEPQS